MRNIRSAGTRPEKILARELRSKGIYFAKNVKTLPGKPDFVFRKRKVIVFVDSDFWHGHPKRFIRPKSNRSYWLPKIARNKRRDLEINLALRKAGWKVIRVWEYDLKKNIQKSLRRVLLEFRS